MGKALKFEILIALVFFFLKACTKKETVTVYVPVVETDSLFVTIYDTVMIKTSQYGHFWYHARAAWSTEEQRYWAVFWGHAREMNGEFDFDPVVEAYIYQNIRNGEKPLVGYGKGIVAPVEGITFDYDWLNPIVSDTLEVVEPFQWLDFYIVAKPTEDYQFKFGWEEWPVIQIQ